MIFSKPFKGKFGFIATTSLAVLSSLLCSPQAQAMDEPEFDPFQYTRKTAQDPDKNLADQGDVDAQNRLGVRLLNKQDYAGAIHYFTLAFNRGSADAQNSLGSLYERGEGVPKNLVKAAEYYKLAVDQGHAVAQNNLGYAYLRGQGVEKDPNAAFKYCKLAADQGHTTACRNVGVFYLMGTGVQQDKEKAFQYLRLAAIQGDAEAQKGLIHYSNQGDVYAQHEVASLLFAGKVFARDQKTAFQLYTAAANQGNANAQFNLGAMYDLGTGVPKNLVKAAEYYMLAADQGHAKAQNNIGLAYYRGEGVEKDYTRGLKYLTLASDKGHTEALCSLGTFHFLGEGVPQDKEKAFEYYRLAAALGYGKGLQALNAFLNEEPAAAYELGFLYFMGQGVKKDPGQALRYFTLAAAQGHAKAQDLEASLADKVDSTVQFDLGCAYYNGQEVRQDYEKAYYYWGLAGAQGHRSALNYLRLHANSTQGHAAAKYYLGKICSDGYLIEGVPDMSGNCDIPYMCYAENEAVKYFKLAAAQRYTKALEAIMLRVDKRDPKALYALSEMHHEGQGVEQNDGKASYYKALADVRKLGFADAPEVEAETYRRLSVIYLYGIGIDEDYAKAFYYDTMADAAFDDAAAQYYLGTMYKDGVGVKKNHTLAVRYYCVAANKGYREARTALKRLANQGCELTQYFLGCQYHEANKHDKARKYFELAASQGHSEAKRTLQEYFPGG